MKINLENQQEKQIIEKAIQELKGNSQYQPLVDSLQAALFQTKENSAIAYKDKETCATNNAWKDSDCWNEDVPE